MFFREHWPEILILVGMSVTFAYYIVKYAEIAMRLWQDWLDTWNTDGGHIITLVVLVFIGMAGIKYNVGKSDDLFVGAFTALLILLKGAGSNKTRRDRPTPTTETATTTVSTEAITEGKGQ